MATEDLDADEEMGSSAKKVENTEINIRDSIIQGSFLPVALMALAGKFPLNDYIIDAS